MFVHIAHMCNGQMGQIHNKREMSVFYLYQTYSCIVVRFGKSSKWWKFKTKQLFSILWGLHIFPSRSDLLVSEIHEKFKTNLSQLPLYHLPQRAHLLSWTRKYYPSPSSPISSYIFRFEYFPRRFELSLWNVPSRTSGRGLANFYRRSWKALISS